MFGQILVAAIAIAVSVALPGGGTFIGGAINAAIGSAVSQAVGVATGIQQKFSFKGVAIAAISGGIAGGISELGAAADAANAAGEAVSGLEKVASFLSGSGFAAGVARGVVSSALTQGIATATGLQNKFSWVGVAAAGVAAGVGQGLGEELGLKDLGSKGGRTIGNIAAHTAVSAASLIASAATRSALNGSSFGDNIKAGLPDVIGQTIGRVLGGAVRGDPKAQVEADPTNQDEARAGAVAQQANEQQSGRVPGTVYLRGHPLHNPALYGPDLYAVLGLEFEAEKARIIQVEHQRRQAALAKIDSGQDGAGNYSYTREVRDATIFGSIPATQFDMFNYWNDFAVLKSSFAGRIDARTAPCTTPLRPTNVDILELAIPSAHPDAATCLGSVPQ